MKKFVRGQFSRLLSLVLMVLMVGPSLLGPLAAPAHAATGGRQNILILPLPTSVGEAPLNLGGRIIQELQIALASQVGVQVNELSPTSPILRRAEEQANKAEAKQLQDEYDVAVNPKSDPTTRVDACGYLVKTLGVDAVVYGAIDQYEYTHEPDPHQVLIHVTATKVTIDKEDTTLASPLVVLGKSHRRADGLGSQSSHDTDAIMALAHSLANLLTGKDENAPREDIKYKPSKVHQEASVTTEPAYHADTDTDKPHSNFWKTAAIVGGGALAALGIGLLVANSKGSSQASTGSSSSGVGYATPMADRVALSFDKPLNFSDIQTYQILRADIGPADSRSENRAVRSAQQVVRTVDVSQMITNGAQLVVYDGPDSLVKPVNDMLYSYAVLEIAKNKNHRTITIYNAGSPAAQIEAVGPHVPPPLDQLSVQMLGSSVVQLTWAFAAGITAPSFISGYIIERRLAPSGAWEQVAVIPGNSVTSAQTAVPTPNQEYDFRVLAQSDDGSVFVTLPSSAIGKATVSAGAPQGIDASTLVVRAVPNTTLAGKKSIHVEWAVPNDSFVTQYKVERSSRSRSLNRATTGPAGLKIPVTHTTRSTTGGPRDPQNRLAASTIRQDLTSDTKVTSTMLDRTQNFYDDTDVQDGVIYIYTITTYAGTLASNMQVASPAFKMDFNPANVTTVTPLVTRGGLKFSWGTVATKADGTVINPANETAANYLVYRSTTFSQTAATVSAVNANANTSKDSVYKNVPDPTFFSYVGTVAYSQTAQFADTAVGSSLPYRTSNLSYVIVLADTAGNTSNGPTYPVFHITPMPNVLTNGVTMTPTKMTVTAGSTTGQPVTIQAMGEDGQLVPGVSIIVDCTPYGTLSTTATKPTTSVQHLDTDITGKDLVVTGKDGKARVYWFPPDSVTGSKDTTITAVEKSEPGSKAAVAPAPSSATVVIQQPVAQKIDLVLYKTTDSLGNPVALTQAQVVSDVYIAAHVSDSSGANVSGQQVTLTCSDSTVTFPDGAGTNALTTDTNGNATFHVKTGQHVGIITMASICGSAIGQARLSIVAGNPDPTKSVITMASSSLAARSGATTTGTVTVEDTFYNKVQGANVVLSTDLGSIDPVLVTTDATGQATFTYTSTALSDPNATSATANIKGQIVGASDTMAKTQVTLSVLGPQTITVSSNVTSIVAENDSQAIITASVTDQYGQPVVDGTPISFAVTGGGVFQGSMTPNITGTTMNGQAITVLLGTPATDAQILTVTASAKGGTPTNNVTVLMQPRSEVTKILVTSDKDTAIIDNLLTDRQCTLSVLVTDAGKPVANTTVLIGVTAGSLSAESATTDANGQVSGIIFTAPDKAQTVTVTAKALNVTGATQITVRGGLPALVEVSISGPWALFNSNGRPIVMNPVAPYTAAGLMADYQTSIYARVTDEYGNPAPDGTTVFFESVEPGTYQTETVNTAYDSPTTHLPITSVVPKQHTGAPYGTIDPQAVTAGGAATAKLLSSDRNHVIHNSTGTDVYTPPVANPNILDKNSAEILVRVNRADGRVVFSNVFRTAGPAKYQNRVAMVGGPVATNSSLTISPNTYAVVGSPISISAVLNDNLNQPCAGNTPYQLSFAFEDGTQAAPPIVAGSDIVGGLNNFVTITDLKGLSHRTVTVTLSIPQQLLDMPLTLSSKSLPIIAGLPTTMTMTLQSLVANGSTTQVYSYPQPVPPANGNLGPDQMRIVADGIVDQFGNPAFGQTVTDLLGNPIPTTSVYFSADKGGFGATVADVTTPYNFSSTVFTTIANNKNVARAVAYYRCGSAVDDVISATCGTNASNAPIHVIGGADGVNFTFTRGNVITNSVQVGADAGSGFDQAVTTVTASANSKKIPLTDAVSVYLNPDQGTLLNQTQMIGLDVNSQIPNIIFQADPTATGGPLNIAWASGNNNGTVKTKLNVIGPPDHFVQDAKGTPGLAYTPATIKGAGTAIVSGYLEAADGTPVLQGSVTVQFATSNPNFVLTPANGQVVVGAKGYVSIIVGAANPALVTTNGFSVSARAGNASAQTGIINYGQSTKTLTIAVTGGVQTQPVDPWLDPKNVKEAEVVISALDATGNPVADSATVSLANDAGADFYASLDGGVTYTQKIGQTVNNANFKNGSLTLHLRGNGAITKPGVCNITAAAENGTVTAKDASITYIGRPAKLSALTLTPATSQVITLQTDVKVQVDDVNGKSVSDGYPITFTTGNNGNVNVNGDNNISQPDTNTASTSYGFAETTIVGNVACSPTVTVKYGGVTLSAPYKFVGSGAITFTFAPVIPRILSDGLKKIDTTVNGFLPDGKTPVADGTPITLKLDKGHFGNGQQTITGTFMNGTFNTTIVGAATPGINDLGDATLTALSGAYTATTTVWFYGQPSSILITDPPSVDAATRPTLIAIAGSKASTTIETYDLGVNAADGKVQVDVIDNTTGITVSTSTVPVVNGTVTTTVTTPMVGKYLVKASLVNDKTKFDDFWLQSVASIPNTVTVAPVGANPTASADGTGAAQAFTITALDVNGKPAGNIPAQVWIDRGAVIDNTGNPVAANSQAQAITVQLDATGTGTFSVNGSMVGGFPVAPGVATVTVQIGTLIPVTSTLRLIGKPNSIVLSADYYRLLANNKDQITVTAKVYDSAMQRVADGTSVRFTVKNWDGTAVTPGNTRFTPSTMATVNGVSTSLFALKAIGDVKITASADGYAGVVSTDLAKVTGAGADSVTLDINAGNPLRISTDGTGPAGSNSTDLVVNATATDSKGTALAYGDPNLIGLPVTISTTAGTLGTKGLKYDTTLDATGQAVVTLAGTATTVPGTATVTVASGAITGQNPVSIAFVGPADATKFTTTWIPTLTDTNGNGIVDIFQDATTNFQIEVGAFDSFGQPVLDGTVMTISATAGLTITMPDTKLTAGDTGKVRWTLSPATSGIKDIFLVAGDVKKTDPKEVEVLPVAQSFAMTILEQDRIYYNPATTANLSKQTSFQLTGYQGGTPTAGQEQANATVDLTTDIGAFVAGQNVALVAGKNGKEATVQLNQAGQAVVHFTGDGTNVGQPNIRVRSSGFSQSINTAATPVRIVGDPSRIITQAYSKSAPTLTDDLRVMQDDPVTIIAEVQDSAGQQVLDGFMVKFSVNSPAAILRATNVQIANGVVRADLASNASGVYTVTAEALDATGNSIAPTPVTDPTQVTIRTYAKTFTVSAIEPATKTISQDGNETAKITVLGKDANGVPILAGTPVQFTILQVDSQLATLVDPLNQGGYGDIQNTVAETGGTAMIFMRGQNTTGKVGTAGIRVASYNTGSGSPSAFQTDMPDLITLYGPGSTAAGAATLAADMTPNPVTPGTEGTLAISLTDAVTGRAYNPSWYTLSVAEQAGVGTLTGVQTLDTTTGACSLTYTLTEDEATAKLALPDPVLHFIVNINGVTSDKTGVLWTKTIDVPITNPATWPGHTEPAVTFAEDSVITTLNLGTEEQINLHVLDVAGNLIGPGREIDATISAGGLVRDAALPAPGATTTALTTGTGGVISLIATAPTQMPAGGKVTITLTDKLTSVVLAQDINPAVTGIDVTVLNAKPVADFKLVSVANPTRLYYDPTPATQIIGGLPLKTNVVLQGLTPDGITGSAGAPVNISVDRGQFRQFGVGAFGKTLNNVSLDTNGQIKLEFEGAGEDTLLGMPTFTISDVNNTVTRQLSQATLLLIGKPTTVTVTLASASIFQDAEAPITTSLTDAAGQQVLDGWKIKYAQASTQWVNTNTAAEWMNTVGPGVFRLAGNNVAVLTNGQSTTTFASNHSGVYTLTASAKTSTLVQDAANAGVEVYGGGGVTASQDLTIDTYASTYAINVVSPTPARINADGSQIASLYVTCKDVEGKIVLENVPVDVTPSLGRLLMADDTTKWVDSKSGTSMQVLTDSNGQLRLLSRGNSVIGPLKVTINNDQKPTSYISVVDTGLVHYGVDVATAVFTVTPIALTKATQRIAGTDQFGNGLTTSINFTVAMVDANGNSYPDGYTVTLQANGNPVGLPIPLVNSQIALTYSQALAAADKLFEKITIKLTGPDSTGNNASITSPTLFNVAVVKPKSAVMTPATGSSNEIDVTKTLAINSIIMDAAVAGDPSQTLIPNYEIRYAIKTLFGMPAATLSANGGPFYTDVNGATNVTLTAGNQPQKLQVVAFYDKDRDGQRKADGSEDVGTSGDIYIGKPDAVAPASYTVPINSTNVAMTATVTVGGVDVYNGYPVTCTLVGAGTLVASDATVGNNGVVNFTYTAPAVQPAVDPVLIVRDGINNNIIGQITLKSVSVNALPAVPTGFTVTATTSKSASLQWNDVAQEQSFDLETSPDGNAWSAPISIPMNQTIYTDNTFGAEYTMRYYRLRAVNQLGTSNWAQLTTAVVSGPDAPVLADINHNPHPVGDVTSTTITLNWTDIDRETGYEIQRSWDGVSGWTTVATTGINILTTTVTVTPNTHNYFRVRGISDQRPTVAYVEQGSWSNGSDSNTPPPKTGTVTATALDATDIQLTWDPVVASGYYVQYRKTGAPVWTLITAPTVTLNGGGKEQYTQSGLTPNTSYDFEVRAGSPYVGAVLWYLGDWSDPATQTTIPVPPVAPGVLTTLANGTTVTVSWADVLGETGYELQHRVLGTPGWPVFGAGTLLGAGTTTADVTGLLNGTTYEFRLVATNSVSTALNANWSPTAAQITPTIAPTLTVIDPLNDVDGGNVTLRWAAITGAASYSLDRSADGGATWANVKAGIAALNYTDNTATLNTPYVYRLAATNAAGNSAFSGTQAITTGPAAPAGFTTAAAGDTVVLTWNNVPGAKFKLQRRTGLNAFADVSGALLPVNVLIYTDSGLPTNTTYDYRIAAVNSTGSRSTYTVVAPVTTGPAAAFVQNAPTNILDVSLTLNWTAVAGVSGYDIIGWQLTDPQPTKATASVAAGVTTTPVTKYTANDGSLQNLVPGQTYNFVIVAKTAAAGQTFSGIQTVTMVPPVPAAFTATFAGTTATLAWTDGLGETKYQYEERSYVGGVAGAWGAAVDVPMNTATISVPGLANGTQFDFQMHAVNASGNSAWTAAGNGNTQPASPTINPVTPSTDIQGVNVTLSWAAITGVTMYILERSTDGVNWTNIPMVPPSSLTWTDGTGAGNTAYLYRVSAHGAGGTSIPSATVSVTTGVGQKPSTPVATADGTQVTLSWTLIPGYAYRLDRQKVGGAWATPAFNPLPVNVNTYIDTDATITANTTYNYRLAAVDAGTGALSAWSDLATVTTGPVATFTPVTTSAVTTTTLTVTWPSVANSTSFDLYRWVLGAQPPVLPTQTFGAAVTSYNDGTPPNPLVPGQTYYYRIVVHTAGGKTSSSPDVQVTMVPPAPTGFTATATNTTVTLAWNAPAIGAPTYEYQQATVVGGVTGAWGASVPLPANPATVDITGQPVDTNFAYRFRAVNSGGTSVWTTVATTSTIPATPTTLSLSMLEDPAIAPSHTPGVTATWTDTNAENGFEWAVSTDGITFGVPAVLAQGVLSVIDPATTTCTTLPQTRFYRVRAVNGAGKSGWSAVQEIVTSPPYNDSPSNDTLNVGNATSTTIPLTWSDAKMESGYEVWMSVNGVQGSWSKAGSTVANVTTYTVTGLNPNEYHFFRVRAFTTNAGMPTAYAGWTNTKQASTSPAKVIGPLPAQPNLPTAVSSTSNEMLLTWSPPDGASTYNIRYRLSTATVWTNVAAPIFGADAAGNITYDQLGLTAGTTYQYQVQAVNTNNNPNLTGGWSDIFNGTTVPTQTPTITSFDLNISSGIYRIYYSGMTCDQLADNLPDYTDITFTGYTAAGKANGSTVTVKTDKGYFVNSSTGTPVYSQSYTTTLDSNGQATLRFQGWYKHADGSNVFELPTLADLGIPTITATDGTGNAVVPTAVTSANAGWTTANKAKLIGPPNTITQTDNSLADTTMQDGQVTETATVHDLNGEPVLANMSIWFVQSYDAAATPATATNAQALGQGNIRVPYALTGVDGTASTLFQSNHSGVYTIYSYALLKGFNKATLDAVTNLTPAQLTAVENANLVPQTGVGTVVTANVQLLVQTHGFSGPTSNGNAWQIISNLSPRINCDGSETTRVTFTALDEDGKKVLPNVPFRVSASLGLLEMENGTAITPGTTLYFNDKSEGYVIVLGYPYVQGNPKNTKNVAGGVGDVDLTFDNIGHVPEYYRIASVVAEFGPDVASAKDSNGGNTLVAWTPSMTVAAADSNNNVPANKQIVYTFYMYDQFQNPYPDGYVIQLKRAGVNWGAPMALMNGRASITYAENTRNSAATLSYAMTVSMSGEQSIAAGSQTITAGGTAKFTRPMTASINPGSITALGYNTAYPISSIVLDADGNGVVDGFQISYQVSGVQGNFNGNLTTTTATTSGSGVSTILNTGTNPCVITVSAYTYQGNGAVTTLVTSSNIYIGGPDSVVPTFKDVPLNSGSVGYNFTLNSNGQAAAASWPIQLTATGGVGSINGASTTIGAGGLISFNYNPGGTAGAETISVSDSAALGSRLRTSLTMNSYGGPSAPVLTQGTVVDVTHVSLTWMDTESDAVRLRNEGAFRIDYRDLTAFGGWTPYGIQVASNHNIGATYTLSVNIAFVKGDQYAFRVVATNPASVINVGLEAASGQWMQTPNP